MHGTRTSRWPCWQYQSIASGYFRVRRGGLSANKNPEWRMRANQNVVFLGGIALPSSLARGSVQCAVYSPRFWICRLQYGSSYGLWGAGSMLKHDLIKITVVQEVHWTTVHSKPIHTTKLHTYNCIHTLQVAPKSILKVQTLKTVSGWSKQSYQVWVL